MKLKYTLLIIFFSTIFSSQLLAKIIYVDADVTSGNQDGSSWGNSYSILQFAIIEAEYGDTIWVAESTYKPTNSSFRTIYFSLNNGIKWFGGFQGNETDLSQRDYELYPTILSGDIGIQGDSTDNSYHVVYTLGTDSSTVIDGFSIMYGQASHINPSYFGHFNYGGGIAVDVDLTNTTAIPKILNCTFKNNTAKLGGGAISMYTTLNSHLNPMIDNCIFFENSTLFGGGGALYREGGSNSGEDYIISNCLFEKNFSETTGGAVHLRNIPNQQLFLSCNFINNQAKAKGGGVHITQELYLEPLQQTTFEGCNFMYNKTSNGNSYAGGLSFFNSSQIMDAELALNISNTNFLGNQSIRSGGVDLEFFYLDGWRFENVNFIDNQSEANSGVLRFEKGANECINSNCEISNYIENCVFRNNRSLDDVSGSIELYLGLGFQENNNVKIYLTNNVFEKNRRLFQFYNSSSLNSFTAFINNCTFYKNEVNVISKNSFVDLNISNSIFWEDIQLGEIFIGDTQGYNIHHSLLKSPDCIINGIDYCGDGMLYNLYPEFRDTMNNDFSLRSCSPAINQGDNLSIDTLGIFFDIEGNPRILDNSVDLGAYETQDFEVLVPQSQHVKCNGGADGAISWVQHGTSPFTFEWDNGLTTGTEFTGLSAGNYSIAVMDADNCLDTFVMTINEPLPLEIMDSVTSASGAMNADGRIELVVSGGASDYQYLWSNGDSTALIENLLPGIYTVTVIDANECEEVVEIEVGFMTALNEVDQKYSIHLIPNLMERGTISNLVFDLEENARFEIEIFNEIGQNLFFQKIEMSVGENEYELPVMRDEGLFFVKIKDERGTKKILKWVIL